MPAVASPCSVCSSSVLLYGHSDQRTNRNQRRTVADTNCWVQKGSNNSTVFVTFKRRFFKERMKISVLYFIPVHSMAILEEREKRKDKKSSEKLQSVYQTNKKPKQTNKQQQQQRRRRRRRRRRNHSYR